jgi:hypothetical protein
MPTMDPHLQLTGTRMESTVQVVDEIERSRFGTSAQIRGENRSMSLPQWPRSAE